MYSSQRRGPLQTVETLVGTLVGAAVGRAVTSGLLVAPAVGCEGVDVVAGTAETEAVADGTDTDGAAVGAEVVAAERSAPLGVTWIGAWPWASEAGTKADSGAAADDELDLDCESITVTPAAIPSAAITATTPISLLRGAPVPSAWAMV